MKSTTALLILEDGTVFEGLSFGKTGTSVGELVSYTGVVGYQEVVTNPSYRGTLTVLTYPIIGTGGVNGEDNESSDAQPAGVIIKEYSRHPSNFRATGNLKDFLIERGVVGIREVDTRAVAVHLREHGHSRGIICSVNPKRDALLKKLKATPSPWETDLVSDLCIPEAVPPAGKTGCKLVALNLGITRSLLEQFADLGCQVPVLEASAGPDEIMSANAEGLLLAGGPGDPQALTTAIDTVKAVLGKIPMAGIGLGHQVMALASGCAVKRMNTGHYGLNCPVKSLTDGVSEMTCQSHSFMVDDESIPSSVEVSHVNVNDGTVEGIRSRKGVATSVQFHPTPDEMGKPNRFLVEFVKGLKGGA